MKRSDALPSASKSSQVEARVGCRNFPRLAAEKSPRRGDEISLDEVDSCRIKKRLNCDPLYLVQANLVTGGPIPLYRYRTFKKSSSQQRADRIEALAEQLALPRAALEGNPRAAVLIRNTEVSVTMFTDPDPFQEFAYPNVLAAKRAIADYLAIPLAKLPLEQLEWINTLVETTLSKKEVIEQVEEYFGRRTERESPC